MDSNVVQTRLGHYAVPGQRGERGYEHTALVTFADPEKGTVNLAVWQHDGEQYRREGVPVTSDPGVPVNRASFHLVSACPRNAINVHG